MFSGPPDDRSLSRLGVTALALTVLATWALSHAYRGIFHDANLYALQALARLHPATLTADVFLKFGSQDRYTLFSPVYAAAARWLGIEPAAAALTLLLQCGLVLGAWAMVRAALPFSLALLGLGLFVAMPGDYGAGRIFTCMEPFLTPRMASEALVLAALAALLREARPLAVLLLIGAALFHPLMAMAGGVAAYCLTAGERRPVGAAVLALIGITALAAAACALPAGPLGRFDPVWLGLVQARSAYLFLGSWNLDDGCRAAVSAATLLAGACTAPPGGVQRLCRASLITGLSGLGLTLIACDGLRLVPFTQLQPWRWEWLGVAVAALLLPAILRTLWRGGVERRAAALLLAAAWLFAANAYALVAALAALLCLAFLGRLKPAEVRWIFFGAIGLLALALVWRVASNAEFTDAHYAGAAVPWWLRRAASFARDGSAPALFMAALCWLARARIPRPALAAVAVLTAAGCAGLAPPTLRSWTARQFPLAQIEGFDALRRQIPPQATVFWPESPAGVWILLDRPSYLSVIQTSGLVFSREGALEMNRRATALASAIDPRTFMDGRTAGAALHLAAPQLRAACLTGAFDFLLTSADLAPQHAAAKAAAMRLYRCS